MRFHEKRQISLHVNCSCVVSDKKHYNKVMHFCHQKEQKNFKTQLKVNSAKWSFKVRNVFYFNVFFSLVLKFYKHRILDLMHCMLFKNTQEEYKTPGFKTENVKNLVLKHFQVWKSFEIEMKSIILSDAILLIFF